ncbi:MAG: hypothetical protein KDA73_03735 [Rhodobacteraceae bacterium]|nr:hypothetical protein [Paracoccaceae bacterium]
MRAPTYLAALGMAAALSAGAAQAQGTRFDGAVSYSARDEVKDENNTDEHIDNDIFRITAGLSWSAGDGRARAAIELGVMNDFFDGNYPGDYGMEVDYARRVGNQRYGIAGRVRTSEELSTTLELGYALQHLGETFDLRGLAGFQFITDPDKVRGRDGNSIFGLGEATLYATPNWAISAAVQGDTGGAVWGVGTEYRRKNWGGLSVFLDYGQAFDDYRSVPEYDAFVGGIRFFPGAGNTLREQRQSSLALLMRRYVEVQ